MKSKHLGTNFDDFLKEEGNLAETEAMAVKRVVAFQIEQMMKKSGMSKFVDWENAKKNIRKSIS